MERPWKGREGRCNDMVWYQVTYREGYLHIIRSFDRETKLTKLTSVQCTEFKFCKAQFDTVQCSII